MTLNIASHFKTRALHEPDEQMLRSGDQKLTYGQFWSAAERLASAMKSLGVRPGDRVVIAQPNRAEAVVSLVATLLMGGTAVPVEPDLSSENLREIMTQTRAIALVAEYKIWSEHLAVVRQNRSCLIHIVENAGEQNLMWESVWRWEDLVMFTDNDTDLAWTQPQDNAITIFQKDEKGRLVNVSFSHLNLHYLATRLTGYVWRLSPSDHLLSSPSTNFALARLMPLFGAIAGTPITLAETDEPAKILNTIIQQQITLAIFDARLGRHMLLNMPAEPANFSELQIAFVGTEKISHQLVSGLIDRYSVNVSIGFALMNTVPLTFTDFHAPEDDLRSYGRPLLGTDVEIRTADGHRSTPYHAGWVYARGPQINADMALDPAASDQKNGWINTHHFGYINEDGSLFLVHSSRNSATKLSPPEHEGKLPEFLRPKAWAASVYGR